MRLKGKVAIVTGATKGVGRGIARRFAEEGASVVLAGRTVDAGKAVEREIRDAGGKALFVRTDLSVEADCKGMVDAAEKAFGPLTTLVNNAAATHLVGSASPIADNRMHLVKNETLDAMWGSDLYGLFWSCKYALLAMLEHKAGGSIVRCRLWRRWRHGRVRCVQRSDAGHHPIDGRRIRRFAYSGQRDRPRPDQQRRPRRRDAEGSQLRRGAAHGHTAADGRRAG